MRSIFNFKLSEFKIIHIIRRRLNHKQNLLYEKTKLSKKCVIIFSNFNYFQVIYFSLLLILYWTFIQNDLIPKIPFNWWLVFNIRQIKKNK